MTVKICCRYHPEISPYLNVYLGPMYASKTTKLIETLITYKSLGYSTTCFKPSIDTRFSRVDIVTHDGISFPSVSVDRLEEIAYYLEDNPSDIIGFDEVQFYPTNFYSDAIVPLLEGGKRVIAVGLNLDFRGNPFPSMVPLVTGAERVEMLNGTCALCSSPSSRTQRIVNGEPSLYGEVIAIGGQESYEARCRACFVEVKVLNCKYDNKGNPISL